MQVTGHWMCASVSDVSIMTSRGLHIDIQRVGTALTTAYQFLYYVKIIPLYYERNTRSLDVILCTRLSPRSLQCHRC